MIKTKLIKVKRMENEEIMIVITMTKIIITKLIMEIITIIMKTRRIKFGNCQKI